MRNDDYANDPHLVPVPLLNQFGYNWGWPTSVENAQAYNQEYYVILGWKDYMNRHFTFDNKTFYSEGESLTAVLRSAIDGLSSFSPYSALPLTK